MHGRSGFAARLERLYGAEGSAEARARCCEVTAGFAKTFEGEPEALFSAPGRTELGGNHTDHQHGRVLAAAVDLDILAAVAPNQSGMIRVQSQGYPLIVVDLSDLNPHAEEAGTSAALIRGVAARMSALGCPCGCGPGCLHGLQCARRQRSFLLRRL
ncbi:MAG: galactokinase family protein [Dysosmobacter sp.]